MIDLNYYYGCFSSNLHTFEVLFNEFEDAMIHWKPAPEKWSLLEIICHLHDEECEDFRLRIKYVMESPEKPFVPINPTGWVTERNYAGQHFNTKVNQFFEDRKNSLEWLQSLENASWSNVHIHPTIGPMSAKFLLSNWLAHDYLHIRQIIKLKYDYLKWISKEELNYAGEW